MDVVRTPTTAPGSTSGSSRRSTSLPTTCTRRATSFNRRPAMDVNTSIAWSRPWAAQSLAPRAPGAAQLRRRHAGRSHCTGRHRHPSARNKCKGAGKSCQSNEQCCSKICGETFTCVCAPELQQCDRGCFSRFDANHCGACGVQCEESAGGGCLIPSFDPPGSPPRCCWFLAPRAPVTIHAIQSTQSAAAASAPSSGHASS